MPFLVRPATPMDASTVQRFDRRFSPTDLDAARSLTLVVADGGTAAPVGWGSAGPDNAEDPGSFALHLTVHPDWRRRGAGGALLDHLLDGLRAMRAIVVHVWIRELDEQTVRFFVRRGFAEYRRTSRVILDAVEADLASFDPFLERVSSQGIRIVSLESEVGQGFDALTTWFDMVRAEERPAETYLGFLERAVQRWTVGGSLRFARLQDRYVGYCSLYIPFVDAGTEADPRLVEQGYVRVREEYRNRGIATALCAETVGFAKRRGYHIIRSDVALTNSASLAVHAKLGYRQAGGEVWVRKSLV